MMFSSLHFPSGHFSFFEMGLPSRFSLVRLLLYTLLKLSPWIPWRWSSPFPLFLVFPCTSVILFHFFLISSLYSHSIKLIRLFSFRFSESTLTLPPYRRFSLCSFPFFACKSLLLFLLLFSLSIYLSLSLSLSFPSLCLSPFPFVTSCLSCRLSSSGKLPKLGVSLGLTNFFNLEIHIQNLIITLVLGNN